jgi:rod shape determining protein RodA
MAISGSFGSLSSGTRITGSRRAMTLGQKLWQVNWILVLILSALSAIGFAMLYSASNGQLSPWADKQMLRFVFGFFAMIGIAIIDIRLLMRSAYTLYGIALILLFVVNLQGTVGMGAQRWLGLGFFQLQPSEVMKLTLVMALARYFHGASVEDAGRVFFLAPPLALVLVPVALVAKQPDLGTALMLTMASAALLFACGVRWWKFAILGAAAAAAAPVAWNFLHDYQKARVLVFLDPSRDRLGAGYHIIQSKIAVGSGRIAGKGFLLGTQSHLNFLPEKQTDFIFTMLAEEFGMIGSIALLGLYMLVIIYGYAIAFRSTSQYGRLVALGVVTFVFLSVFINVAMVMGLIPAKGVPLPLVSYGGTSLVVTMAGFGLLMNAWVHRDIRIGRGGVGEE